MSDLTLTLKELVLARPGLEAIGEYAIPSTIASYALRKAKTKAAAELTDLEAERIKLCESHAVKDDAGAALRVDGQYQFADPAAFEAAWQALLAEPVTLNGVRAVTVAELEGASRVIPQIDGPPVVVRGIPSDVLFALGPFVVDPSESG